MRNKNHGILENRNLGVYQKIFLASLGSWMVGRPMGTRIKCGRQIHEAILAVTTATTEFDAALHDPGTSLSVIRERLSAKTEAAEAFERVTGLKWIL